jgi:NAD-dependent DNA ligase
MHTRRKFRDLTKTTIPEDVQQANTKFVRMLAAAYSYYIENEDTGLTDYEYDALTQEVSALEDKITHSKKYLVDFDSLKTSSSLFYIKKKEYTSDDE